MDMDGKRISADWVALGVLVTLIVGFGIWTNTQLGRMHLDIGAMRTEIDRMQIELKADIGAVRDEIGAVRTELYKVGQRVARIEGAIAGPPPLPTEKHAAPSGK